MSNERILEEILENTKTVKKVIIEKEEILEKKKADKVARSKNAKSKAESKFKMVGTKLNETELADFNTKLESLGVNTSQYIKRLISFNVEENKELILRQEKSIEEYKNSSERERNKIEELNTKIETLEGKVRSLESDKNTLKVKLDEEVGKSFYQRIRALF